MVKVKTEARELTIPGGTYTDVSRTVRTSSIGMLHCIRHQSGWCEHIEKAVRQGLDYESMWKEFEEWGQRRVYVPILPNTWHIYALVILEYVNQDTLKAYLYPGNKSRVLADALSDEAVKIGLLGRGDGRMALRQMILDWVINYGVSQPTGCISYDHNVSRERKIQEEILTDKSSEIAHAWCLRWYNKCARCTLAEGPDAKFDPDLIPTF